MYSFFRKLVNFFFFLQLKSIYSEHLSLNWAKKRATYICLFCLKFVLLFKKWLMGLVVWQRRRWWWWWWWLHENNATDVVRVHIFFISLCLCIMRLFNLHIFFYIFFIFQATHLIQPFFCSSLSIIIAFHIQNMIAQFFLCFRLKYKPLQIFSILFCSFSKC